MTGCGTVTRSGEGEGGEGGVMMISGIVFLMDNTLRRVTRSLDTRPQEIESIPGRRPAAASGGQWIPVKKEKCSVISADTANINMRDYTPALLQHTSHIRRVPTRPHPAR